MGQVLQLEIHLGAVVLHADSAGAACVYLSFKALSADVRGHGNFDRQRAQKEIEDLGAMDGKAMQEAVPGQADAGVCNRLPGMPQGPQVHRVELIYHSGLRHSSYCLKKSRLRRGQARAVASSGRKSANTVPECSGATAGSDGEYAVMPVYDSPADPQSNSVALVAFGGEERLKHFSQRVWGHAATGIGDGENNSLSSGFPLRCFPAANEEAAAPRSSLRRWHCR